MAYSQFNPAWNRLSENRVHRHFELDAITDKILLEAFDGDEKAAGHYRAETLAHEALEGHLIPSLTFDI